MSRYLVNTIAQFLPMTGSGIPVSEFTPEIVKELLSNPNVIYIEEPGKGCILGIVYPHFLNPEYTICQELGWWVEPEWRGTTLGMRLIKQFETAAKLAGADKIIMIRLDSLEPDKIEDIYLRTGYRPLERSFIKEL